MVANLPKTRLAIEFAGREHAEQRRNTDGAPFIEHPIEVGLLLYEAGAPDHLVAAGVLHDVLEKTAVTPSILGRCFGPRIATVVEAVSEDEEIVGYAERKAALRQQVAAAGSEALTVFAADKVSKVRELRAAVASATRTGLPLQASLVPPRRLAHFRRCLEMLEERLGETSLVELFRAELIGLGRDLNTYIEVAAVA